MTEDFRADDTDYLRLLVDRVPTMLAYWDRDLKCRFANRAYEAWFGVNPDRLIGTHIKDLLGPKLFAMNEPLMRRALAGERQVFERMITGPSGVQRPSLAEYIPDVVDGVARGFLVQVTNLTELKDTQAALQRENQLRVQLQAHARELQSLLHERTEMLDVLAHEVRQPLNNASAALQSAQSALSARGHSFESSRVSQAQLVLGDVLDSIDNTLAVASQLARPEPIECADVDIEALITIAIADMPVPERSRIQLQHETCLRTAVMDMSLMRLALRNVLSNALKFSPEGSAVRVRITDTEEPPALRVEVIDCGTGIPAELMTRLFTRGAHGDASNKAHGMGLGLYIVERVMALHRGTAELVHTGPEGSCIRLVLPQTDAMQAPWTPSDHLQGPAKDVANP